jgi:hypothetical protein
MSYNLFLDDNENPRNIWTATKSPDYAVYNWVTATDFDTFVEIIEKNGLPQRVSFDHNLSPEHDQYNTKIKTIPYEEFKAKTGYDCALWLVEYCIDHQCELPMWKVHSGKSVGKSNIESLLHNFEDYQKKALPKKTKNKKQ